MLPPRPKGLGFRTVNKMKIAVVGGGLAGVASAYFLSKESEVHLFDPKGIGEGTSGISAGLVHPYPGRLALLSWMGKEALKASMELFEAAEVELTQGLLRLATTRQQQEDFALRAKEDPSVAWWSEAQVADVFPLAKPGCGLWIADAVALDTKCYLKKLWKRCEEQGAIWVDERVLDLKRLDEYDEVILACGHEILNFQGCGRLPLKLTKGHTVVCKAKEPLPFSLASHGHITPVGGFLYLGSTYEQTFGSWEPEKYRAAEIRAKISAFYPPAKEFEEVELRAGVRISPHQGYRPLLMQLDPKTWIFTGLGSRGLLYHAYLAKTLLRDAQGRLCKGIEAR